MSESVRKLSTIFINGFQLITISKTQRKSFVTVSNEKSLAKVLRWILLTVFNKKKSFRKFFTLSFANGYV
jgi:hypothetical protein